MAVGITVGSITDHIGTAEFLHAFFSTISAHCDEGRWGSRFPRLFSLYSGRLRASDASEALHELREAHRALSQLSPERVVWDIENPRARPPWGANIAAEITSLGNYFVSSTGRDLFALLEEAFAECSEKGRDAIIQSTAV
jgi:2,3-bisphosphoglycerate-dependent phosphoglycerate mutase